MTISRIKRRAPYIFSLIWLLSMGILYWLFHHPFDMPIVLAVGRSGLDILAVVVLVLLAGGIGSLLLPFYLRVSTLIEVSLEALIGLAVISAVVLGVSLVGLIPSQWLAWLIVLVAVGILHRKIITWVLKLRSGLRLMIFEGWEDSITRWLISGLGILLLMIFLLALLPPTRWDAMSYHLEVPQYYLEAGGIVSNTENHFFGFPQLTEMLYLGLIILSSHNAAALLHMAFGCLLLVLMLGIGQQYQKGIAGWLAVVIVMTGGIFWKEFFWSYNDLVLVAYTFAALTCVLLWDDEDRRNLSYLVMGGFFLGFAMGAKYTGLAGAIGIGVLVLYLSRRDGLVSLLRAGGLITLVAILAWTPTLVKNLLTDGVLISPFMLDVPSFDQSDYWYYLRRGTGFPLSRLFLVPLEMMIYAQEGASPYGESPGILLFALPILVLLGWKQKPEQDQRLITSLGIVALIAYLIWLAGVGTSWFLVQTRLLYPIFPLLALLAALAVDTLKDRRPAELVIRLSYLFVVLAMCGTLIEAALVTIDEAPLAYLLGFRSEERHLEDSLGTYYAAVQEINTLPEGTQVRFLWETRSYYCDHACDPDALLNEWWHSLQSEPDPAEIIAGWSAEGYTHILIFESGVRFIINEDPVGLITEDDLAAFRSLEGELLLVVWDEFPSYTLYEIQVDTP